MKNIMREVSSILKNVIKRLDIKCITVFWIGIIILLLIHYEKTYAQERLTNQSTDEVQYTSITINADKTGTYDASSEIQRALNAARYNATDSNRYKIVIPKGVYKLSKSLIVFSNTWIYLEEGTILKKCFLKGCMLKNGISGVPSYGYSGFKNIRLEGGTWDGQCFDEEYGYDNTVAFSNIRFGHATNVEIINVAVLNNKAGHHIECAGINGLTVKGCYFSGYLEDYREDGSYIGKEVLQFDVIHSEDLFIGYDVFDDSTLENVLIENNTFENVSRGVGAHAAVIGRYYNNIIIRNNTFRNLTQQAIMAFNFKNCSITDNIMENVGTGIDFRYMSREGVNFFPPNNEEDSENIDDDTKTVIKNNKITIRDLNCLNSATGIYVFGYNIKEGAPSVNGIRAYDYKVKNMIIENNIIKGQGFGLYLNNVHNSKVNKNIMAFTNSTMKYSVINMNSSSNNSITNNVITSSANGGIYLNSGSNKNIVSNNKISNIKGVALRAYDNSRSNSFYKNVINKTDNGIVLDNKSSAVVRNNTISTCGNNGVIIRNNSYGIIEYNSIQNCKATGLIITDTSASNRIYKNTINTSGKNGVYVMNASKTSLLSNSVSNSVGHGVSLGANTKGIVIKSNVCVGNKKRAICSSINSSMNLDTIKVIYNKGCKIMIKGNKKFKSYMQYNNKVVASKATSVKGEASYKLATKYKGKKVVLLIKDKYGNVTKVTTSVK